MKNSARGSSKVKTGMAAFVILLSSAGAGVYAYVGPNGITSNPTVLDSEWRRSKASERKEQALSLHSVKSDVKKSETREQTLRHFDNKKQNEAQESSKTNREELRSLSDSDKKKIFVMLLLWSTKP